MKRVFREDALECLRCQGRMQVIAAIVQGEVIREVLTCLGLPTDPPVPAPARPPPQADLGLGDPGWDP